MIVSPASRMLSAISLGVFWRSAPSTRAIMRSRKVWPGSDVMRTTISSESTRVPPVTALRSPPLSRITGADSPVIADSSTEAMPSMTSPSPGIVSPADTTTTSPLRSALGGHLGDVAVHAQVGERLRPRLAQRVGLGLAASLRHGRREVGEEDGEPQPAADHAGEGQVRALADEAGDEGDGRDHAADLDDEHDRIAGHLAGVELGERADDRRPDDPAPGGCAARGAGRRGEGSGRISRTSSAGGATTVTRRASPRS